MQPSGIPGCISSYRCVFNVNSGSSLAFGRPHIGVPPPPHNKRDCQGISRWSD